MADGLCLKGLFGGAAYCAMSLLAKPVFNQRYDLDYICGQVFIPIVNYACVCTCSCVCVHVFIYVFECVHVCVHMSIRVCFCVFVFHVFTCVCECTSGCSLACVYVFMLVCACACVYPCVHVCSTRSGHCHTSSTCCEKRHRHCLRR